MSALFTGSAWAVVCSLMFTILDWPPPLQSIEKGADGDHIMTLLFLALFAVGMLGLLIIMFGMAIFCVAVDRSAIRAKIVWFLVFFFTAPVGSLVYFFTVYKKIMAQREAVNG